MTKQSTISVLSDVELDAISGGNGQGHAYGHNKSVEQTTGNVNGTVKGVSGDGNIIFGAVGNINGGIHIK